MSTIKVFHRKTKKGSIQKIVREHYLREDIECGRESCESCVKYKQSIDSAFAPKTYLSGCPRLNISKLCPNTHYVVPDYGVLHNQIDVITDPFFGKDIILLQTVWDEIKRNITLFSRIKQLMVEKRFYVFSNEYNRETFSARVFGETISQYKQRLVRLASEWLQKHFKDEIKIVLLTNYNDIKENTNIYCFPIDEYVKSLKDSVNLIDKLAQLSPTEEYNKDIQLIYEEHLPLPVIQSGIKSGKYFQGKFQTNRFNYLEASINITLNGEELNVLIQGRDHMNRAVVEDIVAIELLPESEWKSKSDVVLVIDEQIDDDGDEKDDKEKDLFEKKDQSNKRPMGKVVGIIRRNWRQYCGVLREPTKDMNSSAVMNRYLFVPSDRRAPIIKIETRQYNALKGQKILVAIDSWPRDSKHPKGHYVRALGTIEDKETESEVLLLEHDVPHHEFSQSVMSCLPKEGENWQMSNEDLLNRTDLRKEFICSVDPPGCTDIDDALHSKDIGNGLFEIGVHIADVSNFVKPNTALDKEAADRGTTVYLVDKRIDMIPGLLSSNLCSLRQDCERLTFSVIWTIDSNSTEVKSTKFVKSVIKSKAAMTYAEAQLKIDSPHDNDEIAKSLRRLNLIAQKLKLKRLEDGALVLANGSEIKFVEMDSETHENVLEIQSKQVLDTNSMVEEFMLLANISVAKKIHEELPELSLLRHHSKPNRANFEELFKAAKGRGFEIDVSNGKLLSESLNKAIDPKNEYLNLMLRMITTRCMTQALYFCSGTLNKSVESFEHFGLATRIYTHFTSPIRRYADLMVHRMLSHAIGYEYIDSSLLNKMKIHLICENINYRNKNAREASRASNHLHSYLYIKDNPKQIIQENGYILNVRKNALHIFIPHLAFEVTYFLDPIDHWKYDELFSTQEYIPLNAMLRQFDKVSVELSIDKSTRSRKIVVKLIKPFTVDTEISDKPNKKIKV